MSIIENLIENSGLKFRGEPIILSSSEFKILEELESKFVSNKELKLFFYVPESSSFMLRLVFTELAYLHAKGHSIYFITDDVGKSFLFSSWKDFDTGKTDVYRLFMKYSNHRIKIFHYSKIKEFNNSSALLVHFRNQKLDNFLDISKNQIIVFDSRDIKKVGKDYSEIALYLEEKSWNELPLKFPKRRDVKKGIANIDLIYEQEIYNFFDSVTFLSSESQEIANIIRDYSCLYSTLTVPIKYYYYCYTREFNSFKRASILPSETLSEISNIEALKRLVLKSAVNSIEAALFEKNQKFDHLVSLFRSYCKDGKHAVILFPSKLSAESFLWALDEINCSIDFTYEESSFWYPELLSKYILLDENNVDCILIPFIPSREILIDSSNLASRITLVLYQHEKEILENEIGKNLDSSVLSTLMTSQQINNSKGIHKINYNKKAPNLNFNIEYYIYRKFLGSLEKEDNFEEQTNLEYSTTFDNDKYVIVSNDNEKFFLHGWQHVILQKPATNNYCWISPKGVRKNQKIVIIPSTVRLEYLQNELTKSIKVQYVKSENINDLISYVAEWKKSLSLVAEKYTISKVQILLKKKGVSRSYVTIRKWFEGLNNDSKESVIAAIINPNYNIGPQDKDDIKVFGEVFEIQNLVDNYKRIFASMEYFRNSNRLIGRKVMKQLFMDVKNEKITPIVKTIIVKSINLEEV